MLSQNMATFVDAIIAVCKSQFPVQCGTCGKVFESFDQFVRLTVPVGAPCSFDGESDPIGVLSYVNCSCNSTLALRCEDMTAEQHQAFFAAVTREMQLTQKSSDEILAELRSVIRSCVESKPDL